MPQPKPIKQPNIVETKANIMVFNMPEKYKLLYFSQIFTTSLIN